jgi:hypothetical protein
MNIIKTLYIPVYQRDGNIREPVSELVFTSLDDCNRYILSLPNRMFVRPMELNLIHEPAETVLFDTNRITSSKLVGFFGVTLAMEDVIKECSSVEEYHLKLMSKFRELLVAEKHTYEEDVQDILRIQNNM